MSEKFSTRNSCSGSPLRSNTFISRGVNSKTTSKRNGVKKAGEKIPEDKKSEAKNSREVSRDEFGTSSLNLTLVGSPAPRSQVRALVSSTSVAVKSKVKPSYNSKSREQNPHEICMEKLYQFADNPTKFVRAESRDEPQLKLDLEFSDRSEESENIYDSHNIAFGENGEYRIPEYDHIRFLQFSVGETQDPRASGDQDDSPSIKVDRSSLNNEPLYDRFAKENQISTIPDGAETPRSLHADGSLDLSDPAPRIDEINPWNSKTSHALNWSKNNAALDTAQSYPLGSAINYKNNINPEVEKFMLNTGPESADENYTKSPQNTRLLDESILSKNFAQAIRLQPFEGSVENSSRTSPATSRTTLSQASSGDGTWHGHSLNSPYFASTESNSRSDSKKRLRKDSVEVVIAGYEETDEYLTIVKNEQDSIPTPEKSGVQKYIFITNQFRGSELHSESSSEIVRCNAAEKLDNSSTECDDDQSLTKMDRLPSTEVGKLDDEDARDISSGRSSSDYCIGNIFSGCSSTSNSSSSGSSSCSCSSSSSLPNEDVESMRSKRSCSSSVSSEDKTEVREERNNVETAESGASEVRKLKLLQESLNPNVLYMSLEEVNLAADYASKLSQIFNRVLKRSESEDPIKNLKEINVDCSSSTGVTSQNTSKLIYTCLQSPNFCTSHLSS